MSSNCPRYKRLNHAGRLQAAGKCLQQYNGKNIVKGYSKHFGVSLICAAQELQSLGCNISETYIEQLKVDEKRCEALAHERKIEKSEQELYQSLNEDDYIYNDWDQYTDFIPSDIDGDKNPSYFHRDDMLF